MKKATKKASLFCKDFNLVVIGQIISLFGNASLRFALSLTILSLSGSAALFGGITAISMIPTILLSPLGGMIADRVNRRDIMVALDFTTAGLIGVFGFFFAQERAVAMIAILLVALSIIQSFYQPAVQASIPALVSPENLMAGNAIVNQVNALAGLLGPILGGVFYASFGLMPIVFFSGICFFLSAVMELFLHIPFTAMEKGENVFSTMKADLKESLHFAVQEKPIILKEIQAVALFNLFPTSVLNIGVPAMLKLSLGVSDQLYGLTEGILAGGALLGGVLASLLGAKMTVKKSCLILFLASCAFLPTALLFWLNAPQMLLYWMITLGGSLFMICGSIFSIAMITFIQKETPLHLIGKVMSYTFAIAMCAQPMGQALYGQVFDLFAGQIPWILVVTAVIALWIARRFQKIAEMAEVGNF